MCIDLRGDVFLLGLEVVLINEQKSANAVFGMRTANSLFVPTSCRLIKFYLETSLSELGTGTGTLSVRIR